MKGKPKYNYGESVSFVINETDTYTGTIKIIDPYGSFLDPSDVSYDILVDMPNVGPCLFKHITERLITGKIDNKENEN